MCIIKFFTNKYSYKIRVERISLNDCKTYFKQQNKYIHYMYKNNIITNNQKEYTFDSLNNIKKHCLHSMLSVSQEDSITNEIKKYLFPITSSMNKVTILPSLSQSWLGENPKDYNVIKISKDLYITLS